MTTIHDIDAAVARLNEQFETAGDLEAWAERAGLEPGAIHEVGRQVVGPLAELVAEAGLAALTPQAIKSACVLAFIVGFETGRVQVPDAALPDLNNVLDRDPDDA